MQGLSHGVKKRTVLLLTVLILFFAVGWQAIYREMMLKTMYPTRYSQLVEQYASKYNVDASLVYAVIKNESNFNPNAKSSIGALGLMQLTPDTFNWALQKAGDQSPYNPEDLYTPQVNIQYGTYLLGVLLQEYHDPATALAAYHAGRGSVNRWLGDSSYSKDGTRLDHIPYSTTNSYVNKVLETRKLYQWLYQGRKKTATDAGFPSGIG